MDTIKITPGQALKALAPGSFLSLGKVAGGGSLEARRITAGVQFYWRFTSEGKTDRLVIGPYDSSAPPKTLKATEHGYSAQAAMRAAEALAEQHRTHSASGGLRAFRAAKQQARKDASLQTLDRLLTDYCDYLESLGRSAHRDARSIFNLHVRLAWPQIAALPAKDVTAEQIADMMRKLIEDGKGRTANKLRSYARSAYQTAKAARTKPAIPLRFKDYEITTNPVADTEPDLSQNNADKNPLSLTEMRAYWRQIEALDGTRGALLRLHLLTGGQRVEQLVNLRTADVRKGAITLHDGKGRPGRPPRPHVVPLTRGAASSLQELGPVGEFALSTDGGITHIAATTLSTWAVEAAGDAISGFQAKRIRSGVETLLAAKGVSQEVRGRVQSHGISGVQARHYDGHDYMKEKTAALDTLAAVLRSKGKSE